MAGEVLKLLEIRLGCRPAGGGLWTTAAGCRRRQQGAPHGEENTRFDADPPIAVRADRGASGVAGRAGGAGQACDAADRGGGLGSGVPRCARPRLLRARGRGRPGLSQRHTDGATENGGGADRLRRAAGRRPGRAVPLGDPLASERPDRSAGGAGGRALGPRSLGARHRGRLSRRERPAAAVAHRRLGARRAALGRLPGLRHPRPRRIRDRLPLRRRHRRAHPAGAAARAGDGGLGLHRDRRQGAAPPDGRLEGGRRDRHGLLPGHARPRGSATRCWSSPTARRASSRRSRPASRARSVSAAWRTA